VCKGSTNQIRRSQRRARLAKEPELTPTERNVISMIRGEINLLIAATFRNAVAI